VGKLNLVDLAGSERQSKTGATGEGKWWCSCVLVQQQAWPLSPGCILLRCCYCHDCMIGSTTSVWYAVQATGSRRASRLTCPWQPWAMSSVHWWMAKAGISRTG